MLEILARIRAIWQSAKLCHWMCHGKTFAGDHGLFDRIFEEFHGDSDDFVDSLVESYYMNTGRDKIDELNKLALLTTNYILNVNKDADSGMMANCLYDSILQLKSLLNTDEYDQGIKAKFDEIASTCDQTMGLLMGRFTESSNIKSKAKNILFGE